ncbi:MAG: hypothetical protein ACRDPA_21120, partial [Solirubrobacteraceae bacterium]
TGEVADENEATRTLPGSITLLRTALFGEARSERFVDYGGFGDSNTGWDKHRRYMRRLLREILTIVKSGPSDEDERDFARRWLTSTAPRTRTREDESLPLESGLVSEASGLAAHHLADDLDKRVPVKEALLRDRLARALAHTAAADVETERHVPIPEFQGVGPVDIIVRNPAVGELIGINRVQVVHRRHTRQALRDCVGCDQARARDAHLADRERVPRRSGPGGVLGADGGRRPVHYRHR